MITEETRKAVYERSGGMCENYRCVRMHSYTSANVAFHDPNRATFEIHHIYFRSQYKGTDRDDAWNLALLCEKCHKFGPNAVHNGNRDLDRYLKAQADQRKPESLRNGGIHKDLKKGA
jgi:hypothetical protein